MRHDSNFVCQACGLETKSASRAKRHEMNHEDHEVLEFFPPATSTTTNEGREE